jgi:hypothetical protein
MLMMYNYHSYLYIRPLVTSSSNIKVVRLLKCLSDAMWQCHVSQHLRFVSFTFNTVIVTAGTFEP